MTKQRMIVLALAVFAAGGAALLARGLMGGGTPEVAAAPPPPVIAMSSVLVANQALKPGEALTPAKVRWEKWPSNSVDPSFVTQTGSADLAPLVDGMVVRAPMVPGEPFAPGKYLKGDASSFLAATLTPGMRAVAIQVSISTVAGGFIQPNDRVDVILTEKLSETRSRARTIVSDIRVLAIDQAADPAKDQKAVSDAKSATLELTPLQAEIVSRGASQGVISLSLRSLGENLPISRTASATGTPTPAQVAAEHARLQLQQQKLQQPPQPQNIDPFGDDEEDKGNSGQVRIYRYGILQGQAAEGEAKGESK